MTDPTPQRPFPPELVDMVLRHLRPVDWTASWPAAHDERQTLSACALVSRSFYTLARPHLFRSVVYSFQSVPDDETMSEPIGTARWARFPYVESHNTTKYVQVPLKTLGMFSEFLDRSPGILSTIRQLRLACYPKLTQETRPRETSWGPLDCIGLVDVISILKKIPNLEVLHTSNITPNYASLLNEPYAPLRALHVTTNYEGLTLSSLFDSFSRVDYLKINFNTPHYSQRPPTGFSISNLPWLEVKSLEFTHVRTTFSIDAWLPKLLASPTRTSLNELAFCRVSPPIVDSIEDYILAFKSQIEILTLVFEPDWKPSIWAIGISRYILDLTQLSSLRELTIGWSFLPEEAITRPDRSAAAIVRYLSTLALAPRTNPHLKRITLFFGGDDYHTTVTATERRWKALAVAALEAILSNLVGAFSLGGIYFRCGLTFDAEESKRFVRDIFPKLSRDNMMIFEDDWFIHDARVDFS